MSGVFLETAHRRRDAETGEVHEFDLTVPAGARYFEGHFENLPVLPGVAQLDDMVLDRCERLWPDLGPLQRAVRLRFTAPVLPGDALHLTLERRDGAAVWFRLRRGERNCASGRLFFG